MNDSLYLGCKQFNMIFTFFAWIFGAFFVGFVFGTARVIGFWGSFLISLVLSPLLGLLITLFSETNKKAEDRKRMLSYMQNQKAQSSISLPDEMIKLKGLLDSGTITNDEYESAKKKLLGP